MKWDFVAVGGVFSCSLHEGRAGSLGRWEEGVPPSPPSLGPLPLLCVAPTGSLGRTRNCKCRAGAVTSLGSSSCVPFAELWGAGGSSKVTEPYAGDTRNYAFQRGSQGPLSASVSFLGEHPETSLCAPPFPVQSHC